eukprot:scaffold19285_cov112-Isochrysis_galbana.AAC.1
MKRAALSVDVLSLSATPIPRTMYMCMSGLREMSALHTPPIGRVPIVTMVMQREAAAVREAIEAEVARGGQVRWLNGGRRGRWAKLRGRGTHTGRTTWVERGYAAWLCGRQCKVSQCCEAQPPPAADGTGRTRSRLRTALAVDRPSNATPRAHTHTIPTSSPLRITPIQPVPHRDITAPPPQVFYVVPRVEYVDREIAFLRELVPDVRLSFAFGGLKDLEQRIVDFTVGGGVWGADAWGWLWMGWDGMLR